MSQPPESGVELSSPTTPDVSPTPPTPSTESRTRKIVWATFALVPLGLGVLVSLFTLAILSMYLTALWDPSSRMSGLRFAVVVPDPGPLGAAVSASLRSVRAAQYSWVEMPRETTEDEVRRMVLRDEYWAAVVVPRNFTEVFMRHFRGLGGGPGAKYENQVSLVVDEAKQYATVSVNKRVVSGIVRAADAAVRERILSGEMGAPGANATVQALVSPISLRVDNIHRVEHYGHYFGTYIAPVVLWVGSLVTLNLVHITFRVRDEDGAKSDRFAPLNFWRVVVARGSNVLVFSLLASVAETVVLACYGMSMDKGFGCMFLLLWLSTLSFCGVLASMFSFLGDAGLVLAVPTLIWQLVTSDGIYSTVTTPAAFRFLAPVLPMHHTVHLLRTVAWGATPVHTGYHVGVLLAWAVLGLGFSLVGLRFKLGEKALKRILPGVSEGLHHAAVTL